jgi:heme o synthase
MENSRNSRGLGGVFRLLANLTKIRITIGVTVTTAMGHFLFTEALSASVFLPLLGVFLLACGSATLNHVQDARIDARMERTRNRPIPSGMIGKDWVLFIAVVFLSAGFYVMASVGVHTPTLLVLGALAVIWYNGIYTPLKRLTAFAIIPGSLIGALPPIIGWVSAGGIWWDPLIIGVAFFLFLWQIPHFWCLLLLTARDMERAGLPTLTKILSRLQLVRVTSIWILALAVAGLLLASESGLSWPWHLGMFVASLWLGWSAVALLRAGLLEPPGMPAFTRINVYLLLVVLLMTGNAVV